MHRLIDRYHSILKRKKDNSERNFKAFSSAQIKFIFISQLHTTLARNKIFYESKITAAVSFKTTLCKHASQKHLQMK